MVGDPPSPVQIRILPSSSSWRRGSGGGSLVHPAEEVRSPTPRRTVAGVTPSRIVYREVKHFKKWRPWLIPAFVVANTVMFVITMYINDCPKNSVSCIARFLGRFSFQPFKENPLMGPPSSTLQKMGALQASKVVDKHQSNISVGASGALFRLLGGMLSELITNWTIYANKVAAFITLVVIIIMNLAVGTLPHVDNFAHIGGVPIRLFPGICVPDPAPLWLS